MRSRSPSAPARITLLSVVDIVSLEGRSRRPRASAASSYLDLQQVREGCRKAKLI
jgi:hypothetical protein